MKTYSLLLSFFFLFFFSCKRNDITPSSENIGNEIEYAVGFELFNYDQFKILKVSQPWAGAATDFVYILKKEGVAIPDSLSKYPFVTVPIKSLVATSTTHLPAIEILDELNTLKGFPGLDYISSQKIRSLIDSDKLIELGQNESVNVELVLNLKPDAFVAFGMDGTNTVFKTIEQFGIPVLYNGDWTEQTPLGKAEWIKFFGALYDKDAEAKSYFDKIVLDYKQMLAELGKSEIQPTVLSGAMYEDVWYLPQGKSWAALFFKDAQSQYLWADTDGVGSLALSFEAVFEKAKSAEFWINPAQYETLDQLKKANLHYTEFDAYKNKKIYSFSRKKGENGGVLYYELGPTRPDLVLKDLIWILHPEKYPNYKPTFYEQLP